MGNQQMTVEIMDVRVEDLFANRVRYQEYPPFQRDKVWNIRRKQLFINYVLRRRPPTSCLAMRDMNSRGERIWRVVDGRQRQEAVYEFLQNGFRTLTEDDSSRFLMRSAPVEPGKLFAELSQEAQNAVLDFIFHFTVFEKEQEDDLEEIFLNINEQEPLTNAERLFIHNSKARHVALELLEHPFWTAIYQGRTLRKESFQAATMILAIEALSFPLNLRIYNEHRTPLNRLILGELDNELTDTLKNTVWKHLTEAQYLFYGSIALSKTDVIPMYQAILLLDQAGFDLPISERGCLTNWYQQAKRGTVNERLERKLPFRLLDYVTFQKEFWFIHAERIKDTDGLARL